MSLALGARRSKVIDIGPQVPGPLDAEALAHLEALDAIYRPLCALLYNYAPLSGHPGGSISSGRIAQALLFDAMDYDLSWPGRPDADSVVYAAGHKALGLYALWALRNEVARLGAPDLLPGDQALRLRLEDLLGFRRGPASRTPLLEHLGSKLLDGHPTPATPFVPFATGASGVGVGAGIGLALAAADVYGAAAPRVHLIEGEGGLTPGRVAEALATAATASLGNVVLHLDWNQSSIDSDRVCREGSQPGDYVQWEPAELFALHDWNVIRVADGKDFQQVVAAQRAALALDGGQPTAIVYRTVKGWRYGLEGRASHAAGHKLCSEGFHAAAKELTDRGVRLPACPPGESRCDDGKCTQVVEACFWDALTAVRSALEADRPLTAALGARLAEARARLGRKARRPRWPMPRAHSVHDAARALPLSPAPDGLRLEAGQPATLRGELARVLAHYNRLSGGAMLCAAADLLGSTSLSGVAEGFPHGLFNARTNPVARLLSAGGVAEDGMTAVLSGVTAFGHHLGVGASYGAFLAPLGHVAARLHAIGCQAREAAHGTPHGTMILVCAHTGPNTGEDGPTHADPQALQLMQENFPPGTAITLTPWEPQELWPLVTAALARQPALLAPFVTRPAAPIPDRARLGLAPAEAAAQGLYRLRASQGGGDGVVVLQGSAVTTAFIDAALPLLLRAGVDVDVFCVTSAELFDALPPSERRRIWPEAIARAAIGITDFTLPTLYRWITSDRGREASLHAFKKGRFLPSGSGAKVLEEAGLDGVSQFKAIRRWLG